LPQNLIRAWAPWCLTRCSRRSCVRSLSNSPEIATQPSEKSTRPVVYPQFPTLTHTSRGEAADALLQLRLRPTPRSSSVSGRRALARFAPCPTPPPHPHPAIPSASPPHTPRTRGTPRRPVAPSPRSTGSRDPGGGYGAAHARTPVEKSGSHGVGEGGIEIHQRSQGKGRWPWTWWWCGVRRNRTSSAPSRPRAAAMVDWWWCGCSGIARCPAPEVEGGGHGSGVGSGCAGGLLDGGGTEAEQRIWYSGGRPATGDERRAAVWQ
jgi:hypothetical protein